jgi:hypothetical protein
MKRRRLAAVTMLLAMGTVLWWGAARSSDAATPPARASIDADTMRLVGDSVVIRVEVLNASGQRGAARRAMHYLRERGFDVVSVGNASERQDSSVVIDRSGNSEWASLAARALGAARVESGAESPRYLDLTLVLGARFRPPAQILYP